MEDGLKWWQRGTVYQIYPRSFCDSNGDGIGDIPGIISKLDYLKDLGIDIIWLSPVYKSPNFDNGYDISDYRDINPEFGGMSDMERLIAEAKTRGIKIIMDLVINHTSSEHEWFKSARDKNSPYRDYYVFRKGKNPTKKNPAGKYPNNWTSFFSGTVWEYDKKSNEYYLHLFAPEQPDLNWDNPEVYKEITAIIKFWLDKGIAGFRCDVINVIGKNDYDNGKFKGGIRGYNKFVSAPKCHEILKNLNKDVLSGYDCFTVGETVMVNTAMASDLCSPERNELNMVFGFEHMESDQIFLKWFKRRFDFKKFMRVLERWQREVWWNTVYFENHDQPRSLSRFLRTSDPRAARMLGVLLFSFKGTPFIFEGQEIGMTNGDFESLSEIQDVESHNVYKMAAKLKIPKSLRWKMIKCTSRDNARTPMQWSNTENGGFTSGKPWLKVNHNFTDINAESQTESDNSTYAVYKKLIDLRKNNPILLSGDFRLIKVTKNLIITEREYEGEIWRIICNYKDKPVLIDTPAGDIIFSSEGRKETGGFILPYEGVIIRTEKGGK